MILVRLGGVCVWCIYRRFFAPVIPESGVLVISEKWEYFGVRRISEVFYFSEMQRETFRGDGKFFERLNILLSTIHFYFVGSQNFPDFLRSQSPKFSHFRQNPRFPRFSQKHPFLTPQKGPKTSVHKKLVFTSP